jgi:membrane-associated phospholipid phosphatase
MATTERTADAGSGIRSGSGATSGPRSGPAVAAAGAVSRIWVGAHWPTEVLTGMLISVAWLALVISVRWISEPAQGR